jgi:hypothetical protein
MGYSYPVMSPGRVPSSRPKLGRRRMLGIGGGMLVVLVVLITLVAVLSRVAPLPCIRGCGRPGEQAINAATYQNQKWGYRVPYDSSVLSISDQNNDGVQFSSRDGAGSIAISATGGNDVNGANQAALNALPSSTFQNMQQIGPVRGAEIGLVNGEGTAWSGDYVDPTTGEASPIGLVVFSSSRGGATLTVTAFSAASNDNADQPYGLAIGQQLDFPVTYTLWKGQ